MEINFRINDIVDQSQHFDIVWPRLFAQCLYVFLIFDASGGDYINLFNYVYIALQWGVILRFTYPHWKSEKKFSFMYCVREKNAEEKRSQF